jgi:hypothetical protein
MFRSTVFPFPSVEAAVEFLSAQSSLAIGAYPMMDLTPRQKEAVGVDTDPAFYMERLSHAIEFLLRKLTDGN